MPTDLRAVGISTTAHAGSTRHAASTTLDNGSYVNLAGAVRSPRPDRADPFASGRASPQTARNRRCALRCRAARAPATAVGRRGGGRPGAPPSSADEFELGRLHVRRDKPALAGPRALDEAGQRRLLRAAEAAPIRPRSLVTTLPAGHARPGPERSSSRGSPLPRAKPPWPSACAPRPPRWS